MNNVVTLSYLMKMGGTQNQLPVQVSKEIWEYLLDKAITITAEYLPGALNKEADMPSQTVKDSSEWKLNPVVLVDPRYRPFCFQSFPSNSSLFLLDTGSMQQRQGCFSNVCDSKKGYALLPFSRIGRILHKVLIDQGTLILITPAWQTQYWYPELLRLSSRNRLVLSKGPDLLQGSNKERHPVITKENL